jgi:transposase
MASGERQVSTYREADTNEAAAKRRRWPETLKRELVAATLEPGASVSIVARRHDLNANQLFKWRRRFAGPTRSPAVELLPVRIGPALPPDSLAVTAPAAPAKPGSIEITLSGGVRVKLTGAVDPVAITAAIGAVMKARRRR